jgi:hypothetical protein
MVMMVAKVTLFTAHSTDLLQNSRVLAWSQVSLFVDPSEKRKEPYRIAFLFGPIAYNRQNFLKVRNSTIHSNASIFCIKPLLHNQIFFDKLLSSNALAHLLSNQFLNACICQNKFGENFQYTR